MRLSELLSHVPGIIVELEADPEITAPVVEDSRHVEPGGLFVARVGRTTDGHRYISTAAERGAIAVVGERPLSDVQSPIPYVKVSHAGLALAYLAAAQAGFPSRGLVMIGVTGTDGKTTTTNLIYSILKAAGLQAGMISTINAVIGDETLDTGLHVTTPSAPEVQHYLARMVKAGLTHCVLETTSHGWAQHRVAACDFDVAVITNIQHEHLNEHGSWENYRDAKALLFWDLSRGLRKASGPGANVDKTAVVNLDDTASAAHLLAIPADHHLTYALNPQSGADITASHIAYGPAHTRFLVNLPDEEFMEIDAALVGEFNVCNILAATTAAYGLGLPSQAIKAGVEAVKGISGRMERIDEGQDFLAAVDFAHTPNALKRAIEAARLMSPTDGRVILVFGSAGLRDPEKRAMMGRIAAQMADLTIITAEDPRTESLGEIMAASAAAAVEVGGVEGKTFWRVPDRGQAIYQAVKMARRGDIVLVCGKGHEQSMCFGATEYPWDDRTALRSALRGAPLLTLPTAQGD